MTSAALAGNGIATNRKIPDKLDVESMFEKLGEMLNRTAAR